MVGVQVREHDRRRPARRRRGRRSLAKTPEPQSIRRRNSPRRARYPEQAPSRSCHEGLLPRIVSRIDKGRIGVRCRETVHGCGPARGKQVVTVALGLLLSGRERPCGARAPLGAKGQAQLLPAAAARRGGRGGTSRRARARGARTGRCARRSSPGSWAFGYCDEPRRGPFHDGSGDREHQSTRRPGARPAASAIPAKNVRGIDEIPAYRVLIFDIAVCLRRKLSDCAQFADRRPGQPPGGALWGRLAALQSPGRCGS